MYYPDPPGALRFPALADQPDGLLAELHEAQAELVIAEHHIRLWRANSVTANMPFRPRLSCAAHEALHEAGRTIARVAENLKREANGTRATQQGQYDPGKLARTAGESG